MITEYIEIGDNKWGVIVCYDYDYRDYDDMWAIMRSFNVSNSNAKKSIKILSGVNTGMAISNYDIRMSVIFISNATSTPELWSTIIHECKHVADAIIEYYDVDWDGEDAAYLTGYLTKKMVEKIAPPCY